jgi:AbrB family looped-hinge helix DNA binding protein
LPKEILGTSKLSHKFQVTIPREVRARFKIDAGDILVFSDENGKLVVSKSTQT